MSHSSGIAPTAATLPAPDVNCGGHMPPTFPESNRRLLTYFGMLEENMRTLAATPGGAPSLMDGEEVGNAPGSE